MASSSHEVPDRRHRMKEGFRQIWGQERIDLNNKDLASLKLCRCIESLHTQKGKVVEIGCGAGKFIRSLSSYLPSLECYAGDIDADAIDLAKSYGDGVSYSVFNAESLPYEDDFFDVVLMFDIVEHVENTEKLFDEVMRISKRGSTIHIFIPCEKEPLTIHWLLWRLRLGHDLKKKHAGHIQRFTKKEFIDKLEKKNFEIKKIEYSTYIIGQVIDMAYYILQEVRPFKEKVVRAHSSKDVTEDSGSLTGKLLKKLINLAFLVSYYESMFFRGGLFAQGLHVTCTKR
ncbi:MAG: class I SAM-dependent methyltransferase [Nitrospirae bacterium]|nr:class I SAM-dependent methyltransferase [Nitrospirota bacterium]